MPNSLFDSSEELTLMKKEVIKDLQKYLQIHTHYFLASQRKRKFNPLKMPLEDFALDALLHIIQSISLTSPTEMMPILQSVIMRNYDMTEEMAQEVIENMFAHRCDTKIIILAEDKMRKHVEGMLKTHSLKEVMEFYRRYLTPRFYEKKNLGQVFTPFPLIDKILDRIPIEIMYDPNSTFFDPSAGMGGFLVALYKRLMITLTKAIPDNKKRHAHIVSKMLFAAELTKNNVHRMKKIFGDTLHVYEGNTLVMDPKKEFGMGKFRVVVGNPPFEKPQMKDTRKLGGDSLWDDFVRKSFDEWLLPGGYFGMLLPPGWRKPSDEKSTTQGLWELMTIENTPEWVEMYNDKETKYYFEGNVSIRMDLVVVKKEKNKKKNKTMIKGTDGKIYKEKLHKFPFLPNAHMEEWSKILIKNKNDGVNVLYSRSVYGSDKSSVKKEKDMIFRFPVIHGIQKSNQKFLYTNKKNKQGGFGVPKVIFNKFGGWNKPILDTEGKYGMSESVFAFPISSEKQGKKMMIFFNKDRLQMFSEDLNWATSRPSISWKLFRNINKDFYKDI